jgi:hypothetical protein
VVALAPQGLLAQARALLQALLDALDERVDQGGLQVLADFFARFDRRAQLIPGDDLLAHGSILRRSRVGRKGSARTGLVPT